MGQHDVVGRVNQVNPRVDYRGNGCQHRVGQQIIAQLGGGLAVLGYQDEIRVHRKDRFHADGLESVNAVSRRGVDAPGGFDDGAAGSAAAGYADGIAPAGNGNHRRPFRIARGRHTAGYQIHPLPDFRRQLQRPLLGPQHIPHQQDLRNVAFRRILQSGAGYGNARLFDQRHDIRFGGFGYDE